MVDLYRNQGLTRPQTQPQMGQQFGLTPQQMGVSAQQSPFHDPSVAQRTQHMLQKFPNMGIPNSSQLQQSLNPRNPVLQAAFSGQNAGPLSRLDIMSLQQQSQQQQQQRPQNPQLNFPPRMPQQPQHQAAVNISTGPNQSTQDELFPPPAVVSAEGIRRSPSHPAHQPGNQSVNPPGPTGIPPGRRPMTFPELRDRAMQLQTAVNQRESAMVQLSNQRAGMSDVEYMRLMQTWSSEVKQHKEILGKLVEAMGGQLPMHNPNVVPQASIAAMYACPSHRWLNALTNQGFAGMQLHSHSSSSSSSSSSSNCNSKWHILTSVRIKLSGHYRMGPRNRRHPLNNLADPT